MQVVPSEKDSRTFDRGCGSNPRSTMPSRYGDGCILEFHVSRPKQTKTWRENTSSREVERETHPRVRGIQSSPVERLVQSRRIRNTPRDVGSVLWTRHKPLQETQFERAILARRLRKVGKWRQESRGFPTRVRKRSPIDKAMRRWQVTPSSALISHCLHGLHCCTP